ncbi:RNA-directed DNA polymerase, eukaryota, reverse transcriptase zinc-binding domain protein [Tanacetum coccineum]
MPAPDKSLKSMHRKVDFMMSLFRSDSKYSDMFKEFESGGASGSGGCGDDEESGDDEDGDGDDYCDESIQWDPPRRWGLSLGKESLTKLPQRAFPSDKSLGIPFPSDMSLGKGIPSDLSLGNARWGSFWIGIRNLDITFGCKQMKLTHVCFADDLLMFCHGDKGLVSTLKDAIEEFGYVSGLKPNYDKSTIIFGSMKEEDRQAMLDCVPFKVEKLHVRYLGVPLTSKRIGVNNCKSLIDKVKSKAFNWKNKCQSYAGRLLLIASVLESIHVYWAFVFLYLSLKILISS